MGARDRDAAEAGSSGPDPKGRSGPERLNPQPSSDVLGTGAPTAEGAFEAFLEERYGKLMAAVRVIVKDHDTAEDIVQEAFARAYIDWPKLWPDGNPTGWVHRVATNLAISWHRRLGRELRAVARLGRAERTTDPPPDVYPELHRAVSELPARQRTAVALYYALGLPVAEAAEAMGCRPGTVKSLLFQARENLRSELGEEEG